MNFRGMTANEEHNIFIINSMWGKKKKNKKPLNGPWKGIGIEMRVITIFIKYFQNGGIKKNHKEF